MRLRISIISITAAVVLAAPAAAPAAFPHVVAPGESLYSIAAADGLTVAQLAGANGVSTGAQLIAGSTVQIPPQSSAAVQPSTSVTSGLDGDGDYDADAPRAHTTSASSVASTSSGAYVVQPGDTLSAIAARAGVSLASLAAANGLDPNRILPTGAVLRLSGVSAGVPVSTAGSAQPVGGVAQGSPTAPPYPTPERVSASQVGNIASASGVSPSLAAAIGWQESGFNNDLVSSADARGVMQILPGTWAWIQRALVAGAPPLAPASATDNVRGGVYLLRYLLNATGGDPALAAAGYYQGLPSVRRNGLYPSTQQYVHSVLALRQRFGGP